MLDDLGTVFLMFVVLFSLISDPVSLKSFCRLICIFFNPDEIALATSVSGATREFLLYCILYATIDEESNDERMINHKTSNLKRLGSRSNCDANFFHPRT